MAEERSTVDAGWFEVIASMETRSPDELIAMMPGTGTEQLVRDFPELGDVRIHSREINGRGGPIQVRSYRSVELTSGIGMVWVHGGGFIFGHLDMDEAHWVALALAAHGIAVLSVDYRKCLHGVCYPAPADDVLDAWLWGRQHAEELGMDASAMHIGGASAGACLTAGVTKRLRDGEGPLPASLVLVYGVLHAELPAPTDDLRRALEREQIESESGSFLHRNYAGSEAACRDPYAFAGNGDVSNQPPVYILNSEADRLRASGELYADRLRAAGVPVQVEFEPNTVHGHLNEPYSAGAPRSIDRIVKWLHDASRERNTQRPGEGVMATSTEGQEG
jgi:acetyl esterase/lipase